MLPCAASLTRRATWRRWTSLVAKRLPTPVGGWAGAVGACWLGPGPPRLWLYSTTAAAAVPSAGETLEPTCLRLSRRTTHHTVMQCRCAVVIGAAAPATIALLLNAIPAPLPVDRPARRGLACPRLRAAAVRRHHSVLCHRRSPQEHRVRAAWLRPPAHTRAADHLGSIFGDLVVAMHAIPAGRSGRARSGRVGFVLLGWLLVSGHTTAVGGLPSLSSAIAVQGRRAVRLAGGGTIHGLIH